MANQYEQAEPAIQTSTELLEESRAKEILTRSEIHGAPFKGHPLTKEILEEEHLLPRHKIDLSSDITFYASDPYKMGRMAVVGYVEQGESITVRTFYKSNSHVVWKYLPNYRLADGEADFYGKGFNEQSITLPIESQKALAEITGNGTVPLQVKNPELVFLGSARSFEGFEEENRKSIEGTTYNYVVLPEPQHLAGITYHSPEDEKIPPERLILSDEETPDFSSILVHWEQDSNLYGKISTEVFASKNGKLKYMFCRDSLGRAWIGGIENDSEIQSTGVRKIWVDGGDLTTPAYGHMADNIEDTKRYGNEKMLKGRYVDFFEKYLKHVPVIQKYLESIAARTNIKPEVRENGIYRYAKNFEEIKALLYKNNGIEGPEGHISADDMTSIIEQYRWRTALLEDIPETDGLRARVEELDKIEKIGETF